MAYMLDVNHDTRTIDFAFYATEEELQNGGYTGESEDENSEIVSKLNMVRSWLKQSKEFYTIKDISEILGVSRKTIETQGVWKGILKTYEINYFFAPRGTTDRGKWQEKESSNLKKVVHKNDLKAYLLSCTDTAYKYQLGLSVIQDEKDDFFRDKSRLMKGKSFAVFLKHNAAPQEIEEIIDQIINKKIVLQSKSQLQRLVPKSDTSYIRFMKCYDHIRFNFTDSKKKATVRMLFYKNDEEYITEQVSELTRKISNHKVRIIEQNFNSAFESKEFEEPIDYLSLYSLGYKGLPDGYYGGSGVYFAVEKSSVGSFDGVNIKERLEAIKEAEKAERETLENIQKATNGGR